MKSHLTCDTFSENVLDENQQVNPVYCIHIHLLGTGGLHGCREQP